MPINDMSLIYTYVNMYHILILHGSAHPRINIKKNLLSKNILFQLYFNKKKKLMQRSFLKEIHALNVYQINILQILTFKHF